MKNIIKTFLKSIINSPSRTIDNLSVSKNLNLWVEKDCDNITMYIEVIKPYKENVFIEEMNNIINDIIEISENYTKENNMTKEQFDKLYLNKAVNCTTKADAEEFINLAKSVGYHWNNDEVVPEDNYWNEFKDKTVYFIEEEHPFAFSSLLTFLTSKPEIDWVITYGEIAWANQRKVEVVTFESQTRNKKNEKTSKTIS